VLFLGELRSGVALDLEIQAWRNLTRGFISGDDANIPILSASGQNQNTTKQDAIADLF